MCGRAVTLSVSSLVCAVTGLGVMLSIRQAELWHLALPVASFVCVAAAHGLPPFKNTPAM